MTQTTKEKLDRLLVQNPRLSISQLAKALKVTPQRVSQLVDVLGYEWVLVKRPESGQTR